MNQSECLQIVLIVVASFGLLFMLANYSSMMPGKDSDNLKQPLLNNDHQSPPQVPHMPVEHVEHFTEDLKNDNKIAAADSNDLKVSASESLGRNEVYQSVSGDNKGGAFGLAGNKASADCYPKDQLSPEDLLPGDANSMWAKNTPATGDLKDQNFLTAGYHVGVNTVGQSLRNANRQLRSEPPNPQVKVSPWMQTTIDPDMNRRPLEIGGCD